MKKSKWLIFTALMLTLSLAVGAGVISAGADSNTVLSEEEIQAVVGTSTDAESVTSPFVEVANSVRDSVVGINNYQMSGSTYGYGFGFGYGYGGRNTQPQEQLRATGSGVVITKWGHVLTNYHVVEDASRLTVTVANSDTEYEAELVGYDADQDIAVLEVAGLNVEPVQLGDSDALQVGEWAIVIGNPLGEQFARTLTVGVVSAIGRELTDTGYDAYGRRYTTTNTMIQVDAAINSGNSGGGMFNTLGQLQGIPARKYASNSLFSTTTVDNIGFCIPINVAKPLIEEVLRDYSGEKQPASAANENENASSNTMLGKPRLGVTVSTLSSSATEKLPLGAIVISVEEGSPAAEAGIRKGDVLVEIDGTVCTSSTALISKLQEYREGDVIKVKLYRAEGAEEAVGDGTSLNLEVIKEGTESNYMEVEVSLRVLENQSSALVKPEA